MSFRVNQFFFAVACGVLASLPLPAFATVVNVNLAQFGTATMTGAGFGGGFVINPAGGNDQRTDTIFHTDNTAGRYWSVALPQTGFIDKVEVVNRGTDLATDARITGATLEVLDASNAVIYTTTITDTATVGETFLFDNGGLGFSNAASVRLTNTSGDYLHAAEVRAFGNADNVAQTKSTYGAVFGGYPTSNGNDGNLTNFSHGDNNTTDIWGVDLGKTYNLSALGLFGRNGFLGRTNGATLTLFAADQTTVIASNTVAGIIDAAGGTTTGFIQNAGYDGVRFIEVSGVPYLHVGELQAFGDSPNVALGKPTYGAVDFGFPTSNGNDGNLATFSHGSVNSTDIWGVDLGGVYNLSYLDVSGRNTLVDRTNGAMLTLFAADHTTVIYSGPISGIVDGPAGNTTSFILNAAYNGVRFIEVSGVSYLHVGELQAFGVLVPEPSSLALLCFGAIMMLVCRRKR